MGWEGGLLGVGDPGSGQRTEMPELSLTFCDFIEELPPQIEKQTPPTTYNYI